jgi:hypothetical protein
VFEVDRLVRSGVVVVCSAGNRGFGIGQYGSRLGSGWHGSVHRRPGNSESAIRWDRRIVTCEALRRILLLLERPDARGRNKPDLVAPGSRIVSCANGTSLDRTRAEVPDVVHRGFRNIGSERPCRRRR